MARARGCPPPRAPPCSLRQHRAVPLPSPPEPPFAPSPDSVPHGVDGVHRLFPLVYEQLRRMASSHLSREATGHTLTTTDLVHEAYLQLAGQARAQWQSRAHFTSVAAMAMRRILVDHARAHRTVKHGGTLKRVPLESINAVVGDRADLLVTLDEALNRLRELDERQVRVVECRFFGGMTEDETAQALSISPRTAKRDWAKARSWLYQELYTNG